MNTKNVLMIQKDIVDEIKKQCGNIAQLSPMGWHFWYNGQAYLYVNGSDKSMMRVCIPFVAGIELGNYETLKDAVYETNTNVKFVKAILSEKDEIKVSLDYDHKLTAEEAAHDIVPHVIKMLDFAASYLIEKTKKINLEVASDTN